MPFKITNHPPRARRAPPRANSSGSSHAISEDQLDETNEDRAFTNHPEEIIDRTQRNSVFSTSEETVYSPTPSVAGDHTPPGALKKGSFSPNSLKLNQRHNQQHHQSNILEKSYSSGSYVYVDTGSDGSAHGAEAGGDHHIAFTKAADLSVALGPDNVRFTTEIESIPCAGVRIAFGTLTGLLAWRFVVRRPLGAAKQKRSWWGNSELRQDAPHLPSNRDSQYFTGGATELPEKPRRLRPSRSTASLPASNVQLRKQSIDNYPRYSHAQHPLAPVVLSSQAVVANFVLDTSSPDSIISPDTLLALGYNPLDSGSHSSHISPFQTSNGHVVVLSVQNVTTQFRIGRDGEANRLGVQFLQDANASLYFPREHGVGPVLYYDYARPAHGIPATVTSTGKLSLQQRVRLIFGLSP